MCLVTLSRDLVEQLLRPCDTTIMEVTSAGGKKWLKEKGQQDK